MTDMWTDDEVAELFASANPVPTGRQVVDGTGVGRVADAGDEAGVDPATDSEDGGIVFDLGDRPLVPTGDDRGERWWLVVGVAATVALIVSLLVTATVDDSPQPADEPTTTLPGVEPSANATAYEFVAALNSYDVEAASALVEPGAPIAVAPVGAGEALEKGMTLEGQIAWRSAWGWQWDDPTCNVTEQLSAPERAQLRDDLLVSGPDLFIEYDTAVVCGIISRNRLGDLTGQTRRGSLRVRLLDGQITFAEGSVMGAPGPDWSSTIRPFLDWAETQRAAEWTNAWDDDGPLLTVESVEVERRLLDEYVALNSDNDGLSQAYEFIAALNDGDADAARALLVPGHEPQLVNAENPDGSRSSLDEQFAWLQAFGTTWERPECLRDKLTDIRCYFEIRNRLGDAQGEAALKGSAAFRASDGAIELTMRPYPHEFGPMTYDAFIYWVNATDPDVAHRIWVDGDSGQIVTEESARLLDEQLTAYLASGAVSLEQDETATRTLVDALGNRDLTALDDAVTSDVTELAGWDRSTWAEMLAWMEANQEVWRFKACHPIDVDVHGCEIDATDALTAEQLTGVDHFERPLFAVVEVSNDRVSAISISDQSDDYVERALQPFLDWLQAIHPDEFDEVWSTTDGEFTPRPTIRAAELHAQHLAEYNASEGGS